MLNGIHGTGHRARRLWQPAGRLRAEAERLGARRVFVTTTKSVAQSALLADIVRDLGDRYAGVYSGITAHSPRPCVIEGARLAREAGADLLVAVGGGSAIDATKVMLIALWQNATTIEDLDLYRAGRPKEGAAPPSESIKPPADAIRMIAVPTTLSAAEFNAFAGISDPRHGIKESFGHRLIVPRVDRARSRCDPGHADGPHAVDRPQGRRPCGRAAVLAAGASLRAGHGDRSAEAAGPRAAGAQGQARGHGDAPRPAVRHVAVDRRRHVGRGRGREPRHRPCAGRGLPCAARPYLVRDAALGAALEPAGQCRAPEAGERGVRQARYVPAADLVAGLVKALGLPGRLAEVGVGKDRFREIAEKSMHDRAVLNNPRPIKGPAEVMEILELAA